MSIVFNFLIRMFLSFWKLLTAVCCIVILTWIASVSQARNLFILVEHKLEMNVEYNKRFVTYNGGENLGCSLLACDLMQCATNLFRWRQQAPPKCWYPTTKPHIVVLSLPKLWPSHLRPTKSYDQYFCEKI